MPIFLAFLGAYTLSQFYRSFLAVIAPKLSTELGLTATDLGLLSSTWFAAFALAQLPVGAALDQFGPRRSVPIGMTAAAAGALVWSIAEARWHVIAGMALIGVGCAPIYMGALYMFGRSFPQARFALLSSWLLAIGSAGNIISTRPLASAAESFGWRGTFVIVAALTALSALAVLIVVRDPPRLAARAGETSLVGAIAGVLRIRALWPLFPLVAISYAVVIAERSLWIGPYLASVHGLGTVAIGNAVLFVAVAMIIGALVYGPLDALLGTRKWIVASGALICAAGFIVLALVPHLPFTAAIAVLSVLLAGGSTYAVLMAHSRAFMPEALLGRGITFMNLVFMSGAALVQAASGAMVDAMKAKGLPPAEIYAWLHLGFAVAVLAGLAVYLLARDAPPRPTAVPA